MKTNIKDVTLLALAAGAGVSSCSRYEEGGFSLKTPQGRLQGEWKLTDTDSETFNALIDEDFDVIFEFDKDGDVTLSYEGCLLYTSDAADD